MRHKKTLEVKPQGFDVMAETESPGIPTGEIYKI